MDSGRYATPRRVEQLVLAPGNRADLLVTLQPGRSELRLLGYDRGSSGMGGLFGTTGAAARLAVLRVTGDAAPAPGTLPSQAVPRDLRQVTALDGRRTLTLAMGMGGGAVAWV